MHDVISVAQAPQAIVNPAPQAASTHVEAPMLVLPRAADSEPTRRASCGRSPKAVEKSPPVEVAKAVETRLAEIIGFLDSGLVERDAGQTGVDSDPRRPDLYENAPSFRTIQSGNQVSSALYCWQWPR